MIDPKTFLNAFNSANEGQYYSIDDLDPIVCGRSGIFLEPIAPDFACRDTIINTVPILFKASINVQKYLPSLDFSSKESLEQFSRVTAVHLWHIPEGDYCRYDIR